MVRIDDKGARPAALARDQPLHGRIPPKPEAAAEVLWLLLNVLEDNTIDPTAIIPTSSGVIEVEWHVGGVDLEIECGHEEPSSTTSQGRSAKNTKVPSSRTSAISNSTSTYSKMGIFIRLDEDMPVEYMESE